MRETLADAQLALEQIDYINAHASSTQLNDSAETASIKQVFGDHANRREISDSPVSSCPSVAPTGSL